MQRTAWKPMGNGTPGGFDWGSVDTSFLDVPQIAFGLPGANAVSGPFVGGGSWQPLAGIGKTGTMVLAGGVGLALLLLLTPTPSGSRRR